MIVKQHAQDLMRISQLPTERAKEKLKAKMDLDRAKIESLEVELARMHNEAKKYDEALAANGTAMVATESWWQKLGEPLASIKHHFFKMHQRAAMRPPLYQRLQIIHESDV